MTPAEYDRFTTVTYSNLAVLVAAWTVYKYVVPIPLAS